MKINLNEYDNLPLEQQINQLKAELDYHIAEEIKWKRLYEKQRKRNVELFLTIQEIKGK